METILNLVHKKCHASFMPVILIIELIQKVKSTEYFMGIKEALEISKLLSCETRFGTVKQIKV